MQRKIFNFESKVLVKETIEKFGYDPSILTAGSAKWIIAMCRVCGKEHIIRNSFFNHSGSACHKACKIEEMKQQKSPFGDPKIRQKIKEKMIEKYGTEYASQNKEIAQKISLTKNSEESKEKTKNTNLERYGVENPFQSEEIKKKIKNTLMEKYGVDHPLRSEEIKDKLKETNLERYGVDNPLKSKDIRKRIIETNNEKYGCDNPLQNEEIKNRTMASFNETIKTDPNNNYNLINTLRGNEFWKMLSEEKMTLKNVCEHFNIEYQSVTSRLLSDEFVDRYYSLYNFPTLQKQNEIKKTIENWGFKVEFNSRQIIPPLELDIFVPDKNFAIEFNGSYWHSELCLEHKEALNKHYNKLLKCREKNIRLFNLFELQWENRREQVLNFIKSILGKNEINVGARKCSINNDKCKDFIDKNHIQGHGNGTIKYFNLIYNNEIVASMTASKHHRQNVESNVIVLNRLCFKSGVNVQGGSSKLFKCFVEWAKNEKYENIVSWSDNCWTEGHVYKVLGFNLEKEYKPDYFYYDAKNQKYLSKQSQKKSNTGCPKEMKEREFCMNKGLFRIWDCGKRLWTYDLEIKESSQ